MDSTTFEEFTNFIREFSGYSSKNIITPETLFEKNLGTTGDDGTELLEAVEKRFNVHLTDTNGDLRGTFSLGPNEYLFHSEGFGLFPPLWLFGVGDKPIIHKFTVSELYEAICRATLR